LVVGRWLVCVVGVNLTPFTPLLTPSTPLHSTSAAPALPQSVRCAAPGPGPGLLCPSLLLPCSTSRVATLRLHANPHPQTSPSVSASAVLHVPCCHAPSPTPIRIHQTKPDQTKPDQTPRRPVSSKQCRPARSCLHRSPLPPTHPACASCPASASTHTTVPPLSFRPERCAASASSPSRALSRALDFSFCQSQIPPARARARFLLLAAQPDFSCSRSHSRSLFLVRSPPSPRSPPISASRLTHVDPGFHTPCTRFHTRSAHTLPPTGSRPHASTHTQPTRFRAHSTRFHPLRSAPNTPRHVFPTLGHTCPTGRKLRSKTR